MTLGTRDEFEYILCSSCRSLSISEIPSNLDFYYKNYPNLSDNISLMNSVKKALYKYTLSQTNAFSRFLMNFENSYAGLRIKSMYGCSLQKSARILDVGCGNGEFVAQLYDLGFSNVLGIDPFLKQNKNNGKFKLLKHDFLDLQGKFDLIIFNHTFEHMNNLRAVSKKIDDLLSNNGLCIIRMPNIESASFKNFKEFWEGIHPPFHFYLPSFLGMKLLFEETNLKLLERRWEHPFFLHFYSLNRKMGISDFDPLGARHFFSKKSEYKTLPLFTKQETRQIKKRAKLFSKTALADYVNYYFTKN